MARLDGVTDQLSQTVVRRRYGAGPQRGRDAVSECLPDRRRSSTAGPTMVLSDQLTLTSELRWAGCSQTGGGLRFRRPGRGSWRSGVGAGHRYRIGGRDSGRPA